MAEDHGKTIKDDEQYEALRRDQGMSKEKAARIANSSRTRAGRKGGKRPAYEHWTLEQLYAKARQVGIEGRSGMNKSELMAALREH